MDWFRVAENFGVTTLILVTLAIAAVRLGKWIGKELVVPFRDTFLARTVAFFDRLDGALTRMEAHDGTTHTLVAGLDERTRQIYEQVRETDMQIRKRLPRPSDVPIGHVIPGPPASPR